VSHYESEREQIEKVKRWWADNGTALMLGLAIGLAGLFGWRTYETKKIEAAEQAGLSYDLLGKALQQDKMDEAKLIGERILGEYPESSYATLSALLLAKGAVLKKNYEEARQHLRWTVEHSRSPELKQVAITRIAATLLAEGHADDAWAELEKGGVTKLEGFQEIKGDVLAAQGKADEARAMYLGALAEEAGEGPDQSTLQLKLDSLPAAAATAANP
jgi:predicted negative regulator of RcsB-dependent stress response